MDSKESLEQILNNVMMEIWFLVTGAINIVKSKDVEMED